MQNIQFNSVSVLFSLIFRSKANALALHFLEHIFLSKTVKNTITIQWYPLDKNVQGLSRMCEDEVKTWPAPSC